MNLVMAYLAGRMVPQAADGLIGLIVFGGGIYLVGKIGAEVTVFLVPLLPYWLLVSLSLLAAYCFLYRNNAHPLAGSATLIMALMAPALHCFNVFLGWVDTPDGSARGIAFMLCLIISMILAPVLRALTHTFLRKRAACNDSLS